MLWTTHWQNHRNRQILTLVSKTLLMAPLCRVISGPIGQESTKGNTKTTGHNLQFITDQSGNIVFISTSYVGRVHDLTVLRDTGVL